ncbi:IS200/IS605 family transposase [Ancylomarina sp. 16SWW S1-10-2]|uniref:IS200/IS605 family transposase n=1 Tax=Ancylomarina sp. 16SWW S1-10-2 TaxID=2499681 RepID=UPI0012AE9C5D|nr:IS200/IS605 family transposase [Ancylomarina sp. 16SWW S1-10-2]MRT94569.1 IS200/IS605 family transposase [Ancylomarina sp. 16SWW S1-10-2]
MANTYTQINIHAIFSVKGRGNIITKHFADRLYQYIAGIINSTNNYSLAVNGHKDHIHVFFELNPANSLSDIIRDIKANSSKWINENKLVLGHFNWQEGYGAFSYSRSQRDTVIKYIRNQEKHHATKAFKEEYLELLKKFEIPFDDHYIFEFYD